MPLDKARFLPAQTILPPEMPSLSRQRSLRSAAVWASCGLGAGVILPKYAASAGIIFSTGLVSTTVCTASFLILWPLGWSRSVLTSAIELVQTEGKEHVLQSHAKMQAAMTLKPSNKPQASVLTKEVLEKYMTMGSGWQGRIFRTIASPFFPSTAQMLVRIQETLDSKPNLDTKNPHEHGDREVIASAVVGFMEGFLQDKKDTLTIVGCFLYALVVGVSLLVDRTWKRADEKRQQIQDEFAAVASKQQEGGVGDSALSRLPRLWNAIKGWRRESEDGADDDPDNK